MNNYIKSFLLLLFLAGSATGGELFYGPSSLTLNGNEIGNSMMSVFKTGSTEYSLEAATSTNGAPMPYGVMTLFELDEYMRPVRSYPLFYYSHDVNGTRTVVRNTFKPISPLVLNANTNYGLLIYRDLPFLWHTSNGEMVGDRNTGLKYRGSYLTIDNLFPVMPLIIRLNGVANDNN